MCMFADGRIWVESKEHVGSVFCIEAAFPVVQKPGHVADAVVSMSIAPALASELGSDAGSRARGGPARGDSSNERAATVELAPLGFGGTILLVDDTATNRFVVNRMLKVRRRLGWGGGRVDKSRNLVAGDPTRGWPDLPNRRAGRRKRRGRFPESE